MKELSIEEKAKAYDEVLKVLHKYDGANIMFSQSLKEEIFPELKEESEDEMIRKALISHFCGIRDNCGKNWYGFNINDVIAWLEKQEAIDVLDKEEREFADNVDSYRKEVDAAYQKGYNEGVKATLEKQDEQPKKHNVCDYCDQQGSCVSPCCVKLVEKNGEQNPAWSEEDEEMLKIVIKSCEQCGNEYVYYWLKSIKDRVQPKQEWSEEDEKMLKDTIRFCELCGNQISANWLKSLRLQNRWKPSNEQMEALWKVYKGGEEQATLASLYSDLKKLKRE